MRSAQNLLTIGARMALQHIKAERIIAHIGFDDIPLAELLDPGITVIAQDPPALGELAAQLLLHRMGDPQGSPEVVEVPTNMLTRAPGRFHLGMSDNSHQTAVMRPADTTSAARVLRPCG